MHYKNLCSINIGPSMPEHFQLLVSKGLFFNKKVSVNNTNTMIPA